jgi:hypothetical protein
LQYADLQDANLQYADLQDANLQDAKLQDANLRDAKLQGAKLRGVKREINVPTEKAEKSYFPILIRIILSNELRVITQASNLPTNEAFIVVETNLTIK